MGTDYLDGYDLPTNSPRYAAHASGGDDPTPDPPNHLSPRERYVLLAQSHGFEPEDIEDFDIAMVRAFRAGILPTVDSVQRAIESGRLFYDFDTGRIVVDGDLY